VQRGVQLCDPLIWQNVRGQKWKYDRCREEMKRQQQWPPEFQLPPGPDAYGRP